MKINYDLQNWSKGVCSQIGLRHRSLRLLLTVYTRTVNLKVLSITTVPDNVVQ